MAKYTVQPLSTGCFAEAETSLLYCLANDRNAGACPRMTRAATRIGPRGNLSAWSGSRRSISRSPFILELCGLVAFAYWGSTIQGWLLAIAAPLAMGIVWGSFVAPRSAIHVPERLKLWLGLVILEVAALALATAGQPTLAIAYGVVAAVNRAFAYG